LPEAVRKTETQSNKISFLSRYIVVFSNSNARLDIFSSMMTSLAFFSYLTAIPFVYLTVFEVSEFGFSTLFSISMVVLILSQYINTRLVLRKGSRKMLGYGLACALISAVTLLVVNYLSLPLIYTVLSILPLMGGVSMVSVNSDALVLTKFSEHSGTATGVLGIVRFGIGALAGPILAYFYNGSALPFTVLILFSILVVLLCQIRIKVNEKSK
jgi:DHA1 family bicyclomycin/chloramphenicol resistance-like MFS transporter